MLLYACETCKLNMQLNATTKELTFSIFQKNFQIFQKNTIANNLKQNIENIKDYNRSTWSHTEKEELDRTCDGKE